MKTDLRKVLSISGQSGLYLYVSQANQGAIVEALQTKKRTCCPMNARMTSLADISIYTDEEVKRAYKKMAIKHHPDKVETLGDDVKRAAEEKFKAIVAAYETIKKERGFN